MKGPHIPPPRFSRAPLRRLRVRAGARAPVCAAAGLQCGPHCRTLDGMDTSTTPHISPVLEPETMTALMLRYIDGYEEVAHQYARALLLRLSADVDPEEAAQLARDIVTEITNDIVTFEEEEVATRLDVALRQLIDRVEAELTC